jgi:hypothetical protein
VNSSHPLLSFGKEQGLTPFHHLEYFNRYYGSEDDWYAPKQPRGGVTGRPSTISACELAQLSRDCVDRINQFRTGELPFSNGEFDTTLPAAGLHRMVQHASAHKCSNRQVRPHSHLHAFTFCLHLILVLFRVSTLLSKLLG